MKKLNKFFAVLVALAMMATLCVSMAFAEEATGDKLGDDLTKANLIKYVEVAEGVDVPENMSYTFKFTPISESVTHQDNVTDIPTIGNQTISTFSATPESEDGNSVYGTKPFSEILNGITWPHAGKFTYKVEEVTTSLPTNVKAENANAAYFINVYVTKQGDTFAPASVTAQEADENGQPKDEKEKVNVTNPVVDENDDNKADKNEDGTVKTEGVTFTNIYTVEKGNEPGIIDGKDTLGAVNVFKTSTKDGDTTSFPFKIDLTAATGNEDYEFTYVIGTVGETGTQTTKKFVNGAASVEFNLTSGQYFAIAKLPAGAKWTVNEDLDTVASAEKYTPKYDHTTYSPNGTKVDTALIGTPGTDLATPNTLLDEATLGDKAAYTNTYDATTDTPEGILISNLPYIALALVAIGGLVAYVVVRRRNADEA